MKVTTRIIEGLNSPSVEIARIGPKFNLTVDTWREKKGRGVGEENLILRFEGLSFAELECVGFSIADALLGLRNRSQQGLDDLRDRFDS
jgi:hypothetical protein